VTTVSGNQPGWQIQIDGASLLFRGPGSCCQTTPLTLDLNQDQLHAHPDWVDWPLRQDQPVEFRAMSCNGTNCKLDGSNNRSFYLKRAAP
jgi:hypothetical protein